MTPFRDQLFVVLTLRRRDDQTLLTFRLLTKAHSTCALCQNRRLFRLTCLEKVSNPRQTTRDIARLGRLLRNTRDNVTHTDLITVFQGDNRAGR